MSMASLDHAALIPRPHRLEVGYLLFIESNLRSCVSMQVKNC